MHTDDLTPSTTDPTEATTDTSVNAKQSNAGDKLPLKRLPVRPLSKLRVQPLVVQDHGQLTQFLVEGDSSRPPSESGERPVSPLPIRRLTDFQGEIRPGSPTVIRTYIIGQTHPLARAAIMGAFLDKPQTDKTNLHGAGVNLKYGVTAMQGWRVDMEDAHTVCIGLDDHASSSQDTGDMGHHVRSSADSSSPLAQQWAFFAVFDGHAGHRVARYCAKQLYPTIRKTDELQSLIKRYDAGDTSPLSDADCQTVKKAIVTAFLGIDEAMRTELATDDGPDEKSGSTVVCALVTHSHHFIINLGDSRGVLSRRNAEPFATEDHKPYLQRERDRILAAGGSVMIQRVNGSLAVSRALGDYEYKSAQNLPSTKQLVSPEPDVYIEPRNNNADEFLLLACDGIYDVMNNQELVDFIRWRLQTDDDLCHITNDIVDACLSKSSRDNMSVILVAFPAAPKVDPKIKEELETLKRNIQKRVNEIIEQQERQHSDDKSAVDVDSVMRVLNNQENSDLKAPPGAGMHAFRAFLNAIIEARQAQNSSVEKRDDKASDTKK